MRRLRPAVRRTALVGALTIAAAIVAGTISAPAQAFKISFTSTMFSWITPHEGKDAIHENITDLAIRLATPQLEVVRPKLIKNINAGVENADITHQWDSAQHFDNATVGNGGFQAGFDLIRGYLASAATYAQDNPQFKDPEHTTFKQIADSVRSTFRSIAVSRKCLLRRACPTLALLRRARSIDEDGLLRFNPNPDPHRPANPSSPFAGGVPPGCVGGTICAAVDIAGTLADRSRGLIGALEADLRWALGPHGGRTLARLLGPTNADVVQLMNDQNAVRAYRAYQDLGHAFHATQDFFAHANYVELMAGVPVGTPIAGTGKQPDEIPVPATWEAFSVDGLRALMGEAKFNRLETGAVYTIWLGEKDYCLGDKNVNSIFNPGKEIGLPVLASIPLLGRFYKLAVLGRTPAAPQPDPSQPGLHYCHYETSAAAGLNKDEPTADEASHANFEYARDAAKRVSELLWGSFLGNAPPSCPSPRSPQGPGTCPAPPAGQPWAGQWDYRHLDDPVTGGFALRHETDAYGAELLQLIGGDPCPAPTDYFAGGYTVPDGTPPPPALPPEEFVDTGKIRGCTVGGPNHLVGRYESNRDPSIAGDIDLVLSGTQWTGTYTADGVLDELGAPKLFRWEGTFGAHFDGDGATNPSD